MRCIFILLLAFAAVTSARAQRHSGITSPPTAPPVQTPAPPPAPIVAVSSGMGPLQFTQADASEPAPELLARQLQADDLRIRAAALAAIGAPAVYYTRTQAPLPHSIQINYAALGSGGEMDAILTVELELHLVSAILVPSGGTWRRVGTITYASAFADPTTNLGTFVRTVRSLIGPDHYTAIYHGVVLTPDGDLRDHEAHVNVINGKAVVTISFVSNERVCEAAHLQPKTPRADCDLTERWLQAEPTLGAANAVLVTATGHVGEHDAINPVSRNRLFNFAGSRTYSCQPFLFSDTSLHYEPTANTGPCFAPKTQPNAAPPSAPLHPAPAPSPQHP